MIAKLLFVYGTLLKPDNEFAAYLIANARVYSAGKFKGKLYDIGEYPGAIADPENGYEITGNIYQLLNPAEELIILDGYEGFGPDQNQPNLFIRKLLPIETHKGLLNCWIYLYNLPTKGLKQITSGNYLNHLNQNPTK